MIRPTHFRVAVVTLILVGVVSLLVADPKGTAGAGVDPVEAGQAVRQATAKNPRSGSTSPRRHSPSLPQVQEQVYETLPSWESADAAATVSQAAGDVDGDGDLDLVCGNQNEKSTLYLNVGTRLAEQPAWFSDSTWATASVALGDIDGDGDLDLVCGNRNQSNTLYWNTGGTFESQPGWFSEPENTTQSIALGDVDGDGDLDLVCGNAGQKNTLYLNNDGVLDRQPRWSSGPENLTWSVALGDVDGDGDLDLVCGNLNAENTLYLNAVPYFVFQGNPQWSSFPANATTSVVLGDVDGDGDLDLLCGNLNQRSAQYENVGGPSVFVQQPFLFAGQAAQTNGLSLGDVDHDGDLDLAVGNSRGRNSLYLNNSGTLETFPSWSSNAASATTSIILADLDGRGGLDLVCGNNSERNTVYEHKERIFFGRAPAWQSEVELSTTSVVLGDVDVDGDLDVVFGEFGEFGRGSKLYRNSNGTLEEAPAWVSETNQTTSVALGDVDGDGDLDLACGNAGESNTLWHYKGPDSLYGTTPVWRSDRESITQDIALGDVNCDGQLDLACANGVRGSEDVIRLYWGSKGVFNPTSEWSSSERARSSSVAFGDVDGDGALDLFAGRMLSGAFGNDALYLNLGGSLSRFGVEGFGVPGTLDVALRDVDGDGDLDLVRGRVGGGESPPANALNLNTGGMFEESPVWLSSQEKTTSSIALGDVDGDGDLDLVCGNTLNQENTLYLNVGGIFEEDPAWFSEDANRTQGVALGDVDGDGDLDLVEANQSARNKLLLGLRWPPFKGDTNPDSVRNHLPNNAAHLRHVWVQRDPGSSIRVFVQAVDVESDPIRVVATSHYDGDPRREHAELEQADLLLATSPEGVSHTLIWNTSRMPFDNRDVVLQLRVVEVPQRVSLIQYSAAYDVEVGKVVPKRPEIVASTDVLDFPVVTVGDTVSVDVLLSNLGNENLRIDSIVPPSSEMAHDLSFPLTLAPGRDTSLTLRLMPVTDFNPGGTLEIHSNDPKTPQKTLSVLADVRALLYSSEVLSAEDPAPLGQALTVFVIPENQARIEGGALHLVEPDTSISFNLSGRNLFAVIPGDLVTEQGLTYWIEAWNDPVISVDPLGAPDSTYQLDFRAPAELSSRLESASEPEFLEGTRVVVRVEAPLGALIQHGMLHYRRGGDTAFESVELLTEPESDARNEAFGEIPGDAVGPRGLEYWVDAQTLLTASLQDPPAGADSSYVIRTSIQQLSEEFDHPAERYRLVSVPLDFGRDFSGTLETLLSDQPAFGRYDPVQWRSFCYAPELKAYVELSSDHELFRVRPGRAYWLISRQQNRIVSRILGQSTSTLTRFSLTLSPGWNQFGNPFAFPVAWDSVQADALAGELPVAFDPQIGEAGDYADEPPAVLQPFEGYFIYNPTQNDVTIEIPPTAAAVEVLQSAAERHSRSNQESLTHDGLAWKIMLQVQTEHASDRVTLAVHPEAHDGHDPLDRRQPPRAPGDWVSISIVQDDWGMHSGSYRFDARSSEAEGQQWDLELRSQELGEQVVLACGEKTHLPDALVLRIVDRETGVTHDVRVADVALDPSGGGLLRHQILSYGSERPYRLVVLAGSEAYVSRETQRIVELPRVLTLDENAPNPFNARTRIRLGLPQAQIATLGIYDVRGRLVRQLLRAETLSEGFHTVIWDGTDRVGQPVGSGVYFYRLDAREGSITRRMVIIK